MCKRKTDFPSSHFAPAYAILHFEYDKGVRLEDEVRYEDGRHPFYVCEWCGNTIWDRLTAPDYDVDGLAACDLCADCRPADEGV